MGRRKKEAPEVHRHRIASAAGELFEQKGIQQTSMDEIANRAGYSKATLYVYFTNKEDIVSYLVLHSMEKLKEYIEKAVASSSDPRAQFLGIGKAMSKYEEEHPFYFRMLLEHVSIDLDNPKAADEATDAAVKIQEEINEFLTGYFLTGMKQGKFKVQTNIKAVIYAIWGMMAGLVLLANNQESYINESMHASKEAFLQKGFQVLYGAIEK